MTTDETTIEKRVEKAVFDKLKDDPAVLEQTQRLEILVLRESDEDTRILMYGELKDGGLVDTARVELELSDGWQTQEFNNIVDSLVGSFKNTLKDMEAFSSL
jgi:hypothetical protein